MPLLSPINIGINISAIAGLFYMLLALIYLFLVIRQNRFKTWALLAYIAEITFFFVIIFNHTKLLENPLVERLPFMAIVIPFIFLILSKFGFSSSNINIFTDIFEIFIIPSLCFFGGLILFFNGWRLDPILETQAIWVLTVLTYLLFKSTTSFNKQID
jgi:hypothetical protein